MKREYVCTACGMIWFANTFSTNEVICPECSNSNNKLELPIFACDTTGWFYASESAEKYLNGIGKDFHYHENHPWHNKKEV